MSSLPWGFSTFKRRPETRKRAFYGESPINNKLERTQTEKATKDVSCNRYSIKTIAFIFYRPVRLICMEQISATLLLGCVYWLYPESICFSLSLSLSLSPSLSPSPLSLLLSLPVFGELENGVGQGMLCGSIQKEREERGW